MKKELGILLTLHLGLANFNIQPVRAEWAGIAIYIRPDGSVEPFNHKYGFTEIRPKKV